MSLLALPHRICYRILEHALLTANYDYTLLIDALSVDIHIQLACRQLRHDVAKVRTRLVWYGPGGLDRVDKEMWWGRQGRKMTREKIKQEMS